MQMWLISVPATTRIILRELKTLALLEFIPTETFTNVLKSFFGMSSKADCLEEDEDSCPAEADSESGSSVSEASGIDRVGSSSLIDNMGAMLVIGAIIVAILLLLLLLRMASKKFQCAQKVSDAIKRKLFYNTLLRYVLQSTLKL